MLPSPPRTRIRSSPPEESWTPSAGVRLASAGCFTRSAGGTSTVTPARVEQREHRREHPLGHLGRAGGSRSAPARPPGRAADGRRGGEGLSHRRPGPRRRSPRRDRSPARGARPRRRARRTRGCPSGPGSSRPTTPRTRPPVAATASPTRRIAASRAAGSRTTPPGADRAPPRLELRLDQDQRRRRARGSGRTAGRPSRSEMKERSHVTRSGAYGQVLRGELTGVEPLHDRAPAGPGAAPRPSGRSPRRGRYPRGRPALQQAVGEPAGRGPQVEREQRPATSTPKCVERAGELEAPARDVLRAGPHREVGPVGHRGARLSTAGTPSTRTRPAITAAWARARDGEEAALDERRVES